jgi:hypothetical protein
MGEVKNTPPKYGSPPIDKNRTPSAHKDTLWLKEGDSSKESHNGTRSWAEHSENQNVIEQNPPVWIEEKETEMSPLRKLIGVLSEEEADRVEQAVMETRERGLVRSDELDKIF